MHNRQINFNQLYYFHVIAQQGSLIEAANFLHVSVSTLSEQLRTFEEKCNRRLFDREGRKLTINETGRRIFQHTTLIFDISEKMLADLKDLDDAQLKYLDIGLTPSISKLHSVQLLEPLFHHQDFRVRIRESGFGELIKALMAMEISLILCNEPLPEKFGRGLVSQKIELVPYVFVGGPKFKHLQKDFPKSLEQAPFFNYTLDSSLRWKIDDFFRKHKLMLPHFGEADDVSIQRAAARHNMCVALLPRDVAAELVQDGSLFILGTGEEISSSVHVIYHGMVSDQLVRKALTSIFGTDKIDME